MSKKIQILVIEDNRLLRDGLAALLDSQTEFKVVACAEGGSAALQRLQDSKPNVVLVDAALGRNRSHITRKMVILFQSWISLWASTL